MDSSTMETKLPKMFQTHGNSLELVIKSWCFLRFFLLFDMNNNKALPEKYTSWTDCINLNTASGPKSIDSLLTHSQSKG